MRQSRRLRSAWVVILIADLGILAYGVMAALAPDQLIAGYESFSNRPWSELAAAAPRTADFVLLLFRLLGAYNIAFALMAIAITTNAFRRGQTWAWWTLLVGNLLAYGAPMTYDQIVGSIGLFEILEFVGITAVVLALAATAPFLRVGSGSSSELTVA